ncbi:Conserved domain protein OS=Verrucomicrobiae bacterium DG1235 GN=VDG1235_2835 PE=4 SV=1: DUF1573 [Gemmata massiliana]|uniref:DUF1573 domain-containing protein n=1 Tax=Gemmata massiliana TaxID=1210884 RepID=A0A6P2CTK2_9BACT|nr:DUF1573 domain-containing protein [Gemmata massiliana]VTR92478.1 Conserved domain protein OS=Verrucomicrobiae bacterium DG1235 GN=VDG1235_2835 PE=4 SV=1: DUF1573 [Gemmata massiliana]
MARAIEQIDNACPLSVAPGVRRKRFVDIAIWIAFFSCLATSGVAGYYATKSPAPAPGLIPQNEVFSAGEVEQGEMITATFSLKNTYPTPIDAISTTVGCSCQEASVSKTHLEPGESATINVLWRVGSRRGPAKESIMVKYTLANNDGASLAKSLALKIEADVIPDIKLDITHCEFVRGRPETVRVHLSPGRMNEFKIGRVYSNSQLIAASYDLESNVVEVRYVPNDNFGIGPAVHVEIETDSKREPFIRVPVSVVRAP